MRGHLFVNLAHLGICGLCALLALASPALGATLHVRNDGVDDPGCGSLANPCRSINEAIANAAAGDKIIVGPGLYAEATEGTKCGGECLVDIDTKLTIESSEGAEATVLDAGGLDVVVRIRAEDVTLGREGKGFMLISAAKDGLETTHDSERVSVGDNLAIGNERNGYTVNGSRHEFEGNGAIDNGDDGFDIDADGTTFHDNEASCNGANGFVAESEDHVFKRNRAEDNGQNGFRFKNDSDRIEARENASYLNQSDGFDVDGADHSLTRNVAVGNVEHGFLLKGTDHALIENAMLGNEKKGVKTNTDAVTIVRNNIFGNDDPGNCGLQNSSGTPIAAPSNFWGVPAGPGANPADATCGAAVTVGPVAGSEFNQPYSWLPAGL